MRNPKTILTKSIKNPIYRPDVVRPGFMEPDILGRAIDFNQLALLKLENEGPTVSLSEGTLKKIFETDIPDLSDTTYVKENRPQRKIKKSMNLADTAVSLSDKMFALKTALEKQLITTPTDEIALRAMVESIVNSNDELIRVMKVRDAAQILHDAIKASKMGNTPSSEELNRYYTMFEWRDVPANDPLRLYVISNAKYTEGQIPYIDKIVNNNATQIAITDLATQNPTQWALDLSIPALIPISDAPQEIKDRAKTQGKAPIDDTSAFVPIPPAVPVEEPTEDITMSSAYIQQLEERLSAQLDTLESAENELSDARTEFMSKYKPRSNNFKAAIKPYMEAKQLAAKDVANTRKELKAIENKRKNGPRAYEVALMNTLKKLSETNDSVLAAVREFKTSFDKSDINRLKDIIAANNMSIHTIQQDLGGPSGIPPPPPPPPPGPAPSFAELTDEEKAANKAAAEKRRQDNIIKAQKAAEAAKEAQKKAQLIAEYISKRMTS